MKPTPPGGSKRRAFAVGFGLATLLVLLVSPFPLLAQSRTETTIAPPPRPVEVVPRRSGAPVVLRPTTTDQDEATARPRRPARVEPTADPAEDPDIDPEEADTAAGNGQRLPRDGDFSEPVPSPVLDGPVTTAEETGPLDGADPALNDTREPEDIAAFEQPPAGFDPLLFQAEVDPILDRRPARLFRFEPYDPIGIKVGSFVLLPEVEMAGLWNSNVLRSSNARSDVAFDVRPSARLVSNWRTHALEFRARGGLSFFNELTSEDDRTYQLETRGRIDITRRTNIEALASRDVSQERRSSIDAVPGTSERANITTDRFAATVNHRFNRLALQLRGSVAEQTFGETTDAGTGVVIRSRDRDGTTTEQTARATWEFKPTLLGFVEAGINQRSFRAPSSTDGIRRDSTGERYRVGLGFGQTGQRLRGEASIGYGRQTPDDGRLTEIDGVILDANLAYRLSELTSFLVSARSEIGDTTQAGSGGAMTRQVGGEVRHAFLRQLIGNAGLSYSVADYEGIDLVERELTGTMGLEYFVDRNTVLFGRYQHTKLNSTELGRDYAVDEVRLGLRLRR